MRKNHVIARRGLGNIVIAAIAVLLLGSCAVDGYEDESFSGGVTNTQLLSPNADSITVTASADGSKQTISWPVVYGAGGYLVSLYDIDDDSDAVVSDSIVDGSQMTVSRSEDTNYSFVIKTLGNTSLNNAEATSATSLLFNTFNPSYATIPSGTDLAQYFTDHPVPSEQASSNTAYDLEADGTYTCNGNVDFNYNWITLRCTSQSKRPTITMGADASFIAENGLTLKNLIIDGEKSTNPLILLNSVPDESTKNTIAAEKNYYYLENPFTIINCDIRNLADEVLNNNNIQYVIHTFLIDNSVFRFATGSGLSSSTYFDMYNNGAGINDFKASNSTFYNTTGNQMKYFIRYNNSTGPSRTGYSSGSVNLTSCTFYNIVPTGQIANYDGMKRSNNAVTYTLDHNIIVNTSENQFVRRYIAGNNWSGNGIKKFTQNTYIVDGADAWTWDAATSTGTGEASYDMSGTILSGDPEFKDPENGDFTVTGASQLNARSGDPRWLLSE